MAQLFDPLSIRGVTLQNRIVVSPMCQYSSQDGFANDWHLVHLGSRAVGGAGLVFAEASAVTAEGRITAEDLGIYKDAHVEFLSRIVRFLKSQGTVPGMQIAHAGRKASTQRPWEGTSKVSVEDGGWVPVAPSAAAFSETYAMPRALTKEEIRAIVDAFAQAARRAKEAGYLVLEIHAAHGYLAHEFFSPLSNFRTDEYGGSFENRTRIGREIVSAVRKVWPENLPLFIRISATDWKEGGWDLDQSVELAKQLKASGRGPGGLFLRGTRRGSENHCRPRLSGSVRRTHPARREHSNRHSRTDRDEGTGRRYPRQKSGRLGFDGARISARSLLAPASCARIETKNQLARAISASRPAGFTRAETDRSRGNPRKISQVDFRAAYPFAIVTENSESWRRKME